MTVDQPQTKVDINSEIKRLQALANQSTGDKAKEYRDQIRQLQGLRNGFIAKTRQFLPTLHERMHQAAVTFDVTHKPRVDVD